MFTWMPGDVRALPIAKWHAGSEGRWDVTIPAEAAKLGRLNRQQDSAPSGAKNDTLQARPARIRVLRDSDLSETFGFALNLSRTQLLN